MKRIKLLLASLMTALSMGVVAAPALSYAANTPAQTACVAITDNKNCNDKSGGPSLNSLIRTIITIFSLVVGIASVIMIMVGGFKFVTAGGDSNSVASARSTIIYALVGLVVVAMAQFIVQFVLHRIK